MKIAEDGVDYVSAPRDYAELFSLYYGYVVSLVRREGIDENNKEDVASEILLRFFERGFLDVFNPALVFSYQGQARPARFKSFLSKFVLAYVKGHRDKQSRLISREVLICDMPVGIESPMWDFTIATWIDVFGGSVGDHEADVLDALTEAVLVNRLRAYLTTIPRRSRYDTCDLTALFDAVVAQIREFGEWNVHALHRRFNVSPTAMHSWLWWLRANLANALDRPLPAKRPRTARPR